MKHYYWMAVDFEYNGIEFSDCFLLKHDKEIDEDDALKQYVLRWVDDDAEFEDYRIITNKGNIRNGDFKKVPWLLGVLMEKYTYSVTLDKDKDEV